MSFITAAPTTLNLTGVGTNPYSVVLNITLSQGGTTLPWSDVSAPTATVVQGGTTSMLAYVPTITSTTNQLTLSWSAAQTTAMQGATALQWALAITINAVGPLTILAGTLAFNSPVTPGTSTVTTGALTVNVEGGVATVNVSLGGGSGGGFTNPMTTAGDLIEGGSSGTPTRLPVGTNGQVLSVVSGSPAWAAGLTNPMTSVGDVITGGSGGTPTRLGIGSNGQVLGVVSGVLSYVSPLNNPMTTVGDIIVGGSAGAATRLGQGANGTFLGVSSGAVGYYTPPGFANPMTTSGDLITGGSAGAPSRLAIGTNGQVLGVVSGAITWTSSLTNPMTSVGDLITGGASGAPTRLAIGSNGQVLGVVSGAIAWVTSLNPMTTIGDIIIGGSAGAATRLGAGSAGQVLTMVSGSPAWAAATGGGANAGAFNFGTVGTGTTTVGSGSNGGNIVNIATWSNPSPGQLAVAANANLGSTNKGAVTVVTSGGTAVVAYTGVSGGTLLTGCTLVSGTGTVSTGAAVGLALPAGYGVYTATLTTAVSTAFTLAHAAGGESYLLELTNASGVFAFTAPTIAGVAGDTLTWMTPTPYWSTGAGAINVVQFVATAASAVQGYALTSAAGPAQSVIDVVQTAQTFGTGGFTIPNPLTTNYNAVSGTFVAGQTCPFTAPPPAAGMKLRLRMQQPASGAAGVPSFLFPVGWVGGGTGNTAPTWSTTNGQADEVEFYCWDGSTFRGFAMLNTPGASLIQPVGSLYNGTSWVAALSATCAVSPVTVGDLMVVLIQSYNGTGGGAAPPNATALSGGGVTTWTQVPTGSPYATTNASGTTLGAAIWTGIVTTAGASTITATINSAVGGGEVHAMEFSKTAGTWSVDVSGSAGTGSATTGSTTINMPSLTPAQSNEMYIGVAISSQNLSSATSGYTLSTPVLWNTNVSTVQAPQAFISIASIQATVAALIKG